PPRARARGARPGGPPPRLLVERGRPARLAEPPLAQLRGARAGFGAPGAGGEGGGDLHQRGQRRLEVAAPELQPVEAPHHREVAGERRESEGTGLRRFVEVAFL